MTMHAEQALVSADQLFAMAEEGHAFAQHYLGLSYHLGLNVDKDNSKAAYWWERAAEQDHREAQFLLGQLYCFGNAVEQNIEKGAQLYRRAAEQGHSQAQINLAAMMLAGRGIEQDDVQARAYLLRAAIENGSHEAATAVARMYEDGKGGEQSDLHAAAWYRKALEGQSQNANAAYGLAVMIYQGRVPGSPPSDALPLLESAAAAGQPLAQSLLCEILTRGELCPTDYDQARQYGERAAAQNVPQANYWLGLMYGRGLGVPKDVSLCLKLLNTAADAGVGEASYALGMMYAQGKEVEKEPLTALRYFRSMAELGNADAMFLTATVLQDDCADLDGARDWYTRAAEKEHAPSQYNLAVLYETAPMHWRDLRTSEFWFRRCAETSTVDDQVQLALEGIARVKAAAG